MADDRTEDPLPSVQFSAEELKGHQIRQYTSMDKNNKMLRDNGKPVLVEWGGPRYPDEQ